MTPQCFGISGKRLSQKRGPFTQRGVTTLAARDKPAAGSSLQGIRQKTADFKKLISVFDRTIKGKRKNKMQEIQIHGHAISEKVSAGTASPAEENGMNRRGTGRM